MTIPTLCSTKLMHSLCKTIENRRKQIIEVVQYIEERLKELDEEKEELKKYQLLDKQRRSLQYTIFEKELLDARQKLEEVCSCPLQISIDVLRSQYQVQMCSISHALRSFLVARYSETFEFPVS